MSQRTGRSQEIHHRYMTIYILTAALFVVVALIISLVFVRFNDVPKPAPGPDSGVSDPTENATGEVPTESSPIAPTEEPPPSLPAATEFKEYTLEQLFAFNALSVVDATHPFQPNNAGLLVKPSDNRKGLAVNSLAIQVAPELLSALHALQADLNEHFADSDESGRHQLLLMEGYVTDFTIFIQCGDKEQYEDISYSDHATGYSIDIRFNNDSRGFSYSAEAANYLREVCGKYGLITPDIVGDLKAGDLSAKAWHLRYVGTPYAEYIMANDLTVEEFFEDVKGYSFNKRLTLPAGTAESPQNYQLYYVKADLNGTTRVPVPTEQKYTVLTNGKDGYIVLVETN